VSWHGWQYDMTTVSCHESGDSVKTYTIEVRGDDFGSMRVHDFN